MSRRDHRELTFRDDNDRRRFLDETDHTDRTASVSVSSA